MAKFHDSGLGGADNRPRIHIWPTDHKHHHAYSVGATGRRITPAGPHSIGQSIDTALQGIDASKGVVVIIEPRLD